MRFLLRQGMCSNFEMAKSYEEKTNVVDSGFRIF